jgi:hypothetical protein
VQIWWSFDGDSVVKGGIIYGFCCTKNRRGS